MAPVRARCLLSGINLALAGDAPAATVTPPDPPASALRASISVAGGSSTTNTTSSSGTTSTRFVGSASGGTPPYSIAIYRSNGNNHTRLNSPGSSSSTVSWSGLGVGYESTTAYASVSDSAGHSASSSSAVIGINRTS